jgi:TolB-like protein/DNA-binding SARP family transcriptional activator
MIELRTLGALELRGCDPGRVAALVAQPKRLALLAYLAIATPRGFHRRDILVALFWPESDQERARAALRHALSFLRQQLGHAVVLTRGDEVGLDRAAVWCDATAFEAPVDAQTAAELVALYRGDLLGGLHVSDAPEFERWLDGERRRLRARAADAAWALAAGEEGGGNWGAAVAHARRAVLLSSDYEQPTRRLIELLDRGGDRAAAIQEYQALERRLAQELDVSPSPETRALIARIRARETVASTSTRPLEEIAPPSGHPGPAGAMAEWGIGRRSVHWRRYAGLAALVILAAYGLFTRFRTSGTSRAAGRPMLVVLPFENLGAPADEYFTEGVTEEIMARLAGLRGLGVIGRTSATQYKQTTKTIPQIGQELGVDYILEGTVRWEKPPHGPNRVRVTSQLVRVSDASHVWAKVYDAVLADVLDVQSNIAMQVADTLNVTLLAPERQALAVRPTANLGAYDYYLRGKDYWTRYYVEEDAQVAVRMFGRAVQLDTTFALAYAALARAHLWLSWTFGRSGELAGVKQALDRALQLGPDLPETHLARGYYFYYGPRDYARALEQFAWVWARRPNDPDVIKAIGFIHRRRGQWTEAVSQLTRALELDPRDHTGWLDLADTYGLMRRYAEAERALERATALAPDVPVYHGMRAYLSLKKDGDTARARLVLEEEPPSLDRAAILAWSTVLLRVFAVPYAAALNRLTLAGAGGPGTAGAGGDSSQYYLAKAEAFAAWSEIPAAQAYYDSARVVLEARLAARGINKSAEQWPIEVPLALAYAGLGRKADAIRLARAGAQLVPVSRDAFAGPNALDRLAEIYVRTGEYDAALDQVEYLLSIPSEVSGPVLRADPLWAPLRGNPRFERLIRGSS